MPEPIVILAGGEIVPAAAGETLLAAMQRAERKLQSVCKGRGMCGACRGLVDAEFYDLLVPPKDSEVRLLHYLKEGSARNRLACQITLDETLSGLRITPDPLPIRTPQKETTT